MLWIDLSLFATYFNNLVAISSLIKALKQLRLVTAPDLLPLVTFLLLGLVHDQVRETELINMYFPAMIQSNSLRLYSVSWTCFLSGNLLLGFV